MRQQECASESQHCPCMPLCSSVVVYEVLVNWRRQRRHCWYQYCYKQVFNLILTFSIDCVSASKHDTVQADSSMCASLINARVLSDFAKNVRAATCGYVNVSVAEYMMMIGEE